MREIWCIRCWLRPSKTPPCFIDNRSFLVAQRVLISTPPYCHYKKCHRCQSSRWLLVAAWLLVLSWHLPWHQQATARASCVAVLPMATAWEESQVSQVSALVAWPPWPWAVPSRPRHKWCEMHMMHPRRRFWREFGEVLYYRLYYILKEGHRADF